MVLRCNNQLIVGSSNRRDDGDGEDARPGWSVWGGVFFSFRGSESNNENNYKKKMTKALDGRRSITYMQQPTKNMQAYGGGVGYAARPRKDIREP